MFSRGIRTSALTIRNMPNRMKPNNVINLYFIFLHYKYIYLVHNSVTKPVNFYLRLTFNVRPDRICPDNRNVSNVATPIYKGLIRSELIFSTLAKFSEKSREGDENLIK